MQVTVYFHTYRSCTTRDELLIKATGATKFEFSKSLLPLKVDSLIRALRLVKEAEFVLLLRFDVLFSAPVTEWNVNWDAMNLPFRDAGGTYEAENRTSDLLFAFPFRDTETFIRALKFSGNLKDHRGHKRSAAQHVVPVLGDVHFIDNDLRLSSTLVVGAPDRSYNESSFILGIDRSCNGLIQGPCFLPSHHHLRGGLLDIDIDIDR